MDYLRSYQPTTKTFDHPTLFNQIVPNKRRDIIDNTTHSLDTAKQQKFEILDPVAFARDPSLRDVYFAIQQGARTYSSIGGVGLGPESIAADSALLRTPQMAHSIHNLNPQPQLFHAMPYLGRGSVDPTLERKLTAGIHRPIEKRRTTLPDTSTSSEDYLNTHRNIMNNGTMHELYGRSMIPGIAEEQLGGMPQYGAHTRMVKYQQQR